MDINTVVIFIVYPAYGQIIPPLIWKHCFIDIFPMLVERKIP